MKLLSFLEICDVNELNGIKFNQNQQIVGANCVRPNNFYYLNQRIFYDFIHCHIAIAEYFVILLMNPYHDI